MIRLHLLFTYLAILFFFVNANAGESFGELARKQKDSSSKQNQFDYIDDVTAKDLHQITDNQLLVRVSAILEKWQNSGILVKQGFTYKITAKGQWQIGPLCNPTDPDGAGVYTALCWDLGGQTVKGFTHSALIGKIGRDSKPFFVGKDYEFTAEEEGALYFLTNDSPGFFFDNTGFLSVTINLKSTNIKEGNMKSIPDTSDDGSTGGEVTGSGSRIKGGGGGRPPKNPQ